MSITMDGNLRRVAFAILALASVNGCAAMNAKTKGAIIGAGAGATVGGVIGNQTGSTTRGAITMTSRCLPRCRPWAGRRGPVWAASS